MTKIVLITYHYPHLKTEQVILNFLRLYPPHYMVIYSLPYLSRERRQVLIEHRPAQYKAVAPEVIAKAYGIEYVNVNCDEEIPSGCDLYIILGAGILSRSFVQNKKIINCHPGVLPAVRGLDAFKWTIYEMKPLGVTLHYIDEEVDKGEIISVVPTHVFKTDDLETLARRHYENEIYVLSNFEKYIEKPENPFKGIEEGEPHRRMPISIEKEMVRKFEEWKNKYSL